ncbi:MAG: hypothetical protein VX899_09640 [Myxococcota bacterium]|nr:hypothetical protein [Myxococcota bacterium]
MARAPGARPWQLLAPRGTGLLNRWRKASRQEKVGYAVFGGFALLFWAFLFGGLIVVVDQFYQVEVFGPLITRKLLELLVLALFGMLCFSNVVTSLSSFYLSEDLELLLSLPVSPRVFFNTRLLDTLAQSSWMMGMFGLPVFLAFGFAASAGWAYYASLLVVVPAFLLIPSSLGAIVASLLVTGVSARRAREALAVVGVLFLVAVFMLLRLMQPERLMNAQDFESIAAYVATLQNPMPLLFPPRWAASVLGASMQGRPYPWMELGLLLAGAVGFGGVSRWITTWLFPDGWTRAQEANRARLSRNTLFDRFLQAITRPLSRPMAAVIVKDAKSFVRDPSQWSQIFLLASLIAIYLFSVQALPIDVVGAGYMQDAKNALAYLNLGMAGFVMAAIAVRFQYAQISGEGRAFWMLRTAPIDPERYLWAKALPGLVPMLVVGGAITMATNAILNSPTMLFVVSGLTAVGFAFGISGIAVGMGATYPDFKADNVARAASGPGAIVFMVASLGLVFAVVAALGVPVYFILLQDRSGGSLLPHQWALTAGFGLLAAGFCALATVIPVRRAAPGLWARNL